MEKQPKKTSLEEKPLITETLTETESIQEGGSELSSNEILRNIRNELGRQDLNEKDAEQFLETAIQEKTESKNQAERALGLFTIKLADPDPIMDEPLEKHYLQRRGMASIETPTTTFLFREFSHFGLHGLAFLPGKIRELKENLSQTKNPIKKILLPKKIAEMEKNLNDIKEERRKKYQEYKNTRKSLEDFLNESSSNPLLSQTKKRIDDIWSGKTPKVTIKNILKGLEVKAKEQYLSDEKEISKLKRLLNDLEKVSE